MNKKIIIGIGLLMVLIATFSSFTLAASKAYETITKSGGWEPHYVGGIQYGHINRDLNLRITDTIPQYTDSVTIFKLDNTGKRIGSPTIIQKDSDVTISSDNKITYTYDYRDYFGRDDAAGIKVYDPSIDTRTNLDGRTRTTGGGIEAAPTITTDPTATEPEVTEQAVTEPTEEVPSETPEQKAIIGVNRAIIQRRKNVEGMFKLKTPQKTTEEDITREEEVKIVKVLKVIRGEVDYSKLTLDDIKAAKDSPAYNAFKDKIDEMEKDLNDLEAIKKSGYKEYAKRLTGVDPETGEEIPAEQRMTEEDLRQYKERAKKYGYGSVVRTINRARNEKTRRDRLKRYTESKENFKRYAGFLQVSQGARAIESLFEYMFKGPIGYDVSKLEGPAYDFKRLWGLGLKEQYYERACGDLASSYFVQDYPGHFVGGGAYPNIGSILYVQGKRTEYEFANWPQATYKPGGNPPKWFPIQTDEGIKARGYLYKISWQAGNPYEQWQYDAMTQRERDRLGLGENGTISYTVKMTVNPHYTEDGVTIKEFDFKDKLEPIKPGEIQKEVFVFYSKAYIDQICLTFDKYLYDGNRKKYPCQKVVKQELKSQIPKGFEYTPTTEVTITTSEGTRPAGCNLPAELC